MPDEIPDAAAAPPADDDDAAAADAGSADIETVTDPEMSGPAETASFPAWQEAATPEEPEPVEPAWREAGMPAGLEPAAVREAAPADAPDPAAMVFRESAAPDDPAPTPWPTDSSDGHGAGDAALETLPPPPTHADWRQLADEVRRLAAQIAHGRA